MTSRTSQKIQIQSHTNPSQPRSTLYKAKILLQYHAERLTLLHLLIQVIFTVSVQTAVDSLVNSCASMSEEEETVSKRSAFKRFQIFMVTNTLSWVVQILKTRITIVIIRIRAIQPWLKINRCSILFRFNLFTQLKITRSMACNSRLSLSSHLCTEK